MMDIFNDILLLSNKVSSNKEHCKTEEATKTSLVLPFFSILGYDITNPLEVIPEAPCAIKGYDRIDYILASCGENHMLVECKHWKENLNNHVKQLEQYYQAGLRPYGTRIGVLTNGIEWRFYADTERPNMMDSDPFFVFYISSISNNAIESLKILCKDNFDAQKVVEEARKMKLATRLHDIVECELSNPSDRLVDFFWTKMNTGIKLSRQMREVFTPMVKDEVANYTINRANRDVETSDKVTEKTDVRERCNDGELPAEIEESMSVIRGILKDKIEPNRIQAEPRSGYYAVRLDGNQWRPVCKLHMTEYGRWIIVGRYWPQSRKFYTSVKHKHELNSPADIKSYSQELIDIITVMLLNSHAERINWVNEHHKDWLE